MKRVLLWILVVLIGLVGLGLVVGFFAARAAKLDPIVVVRDAVTGFQSGSERHRTAQQLPRPWDPIGDANQRVEAVPMEERAYPLLAKAAAMMEVADADELLSRFPGDDGWEKTAAWVTSEDAQAIVRVLEQAAEKSALGAPFSNAPDPTWQQAREEYGLEPETGHPAEHPTIVDVLMPALRAQREFARLLMADAEVSRLGGDTDRMLSRVETATRLTVMQSELNMLIEQMVSYACIMLIRDHVCRMLQDPRDMLNDRVASNLEAQLQSVTGNGILEIDCQSENLVVEDLLRRLVDANGVFRGSGVTNVSDTQPGFGLPAPSSVQESAINREIWEALQLCRRHADGAKHAATPPWASIADQKAEVKAFIDAPSGVPGRIAKLIISILYPNWSTFVASHRRAASEFLGLRVALAAHRHQLRHDQPPQSLDAIDPDLITFDPVDGFTGGRLVYRWTDAGHLVYAAGPDGDDDGGRPIDPPADGDWGRGISDRLLEDKPDGDYILFPPQE